MLLVQNNSVREYMQHSAGFCTSKPRSNPHNATQGIRRARQCAHKTCYKLYEPTRGRWTHYVNTLNMHAPSNISEIVTATTCAAFTRLRGQHVSSVDSPTNTYTHAYTHNTRIVTQPPEWKIHAKVQYCDTWSGWLWQRLQDTFTYTRHTCMHY